MRPSLYRLTQLQTFVLLPLLAVLLAGCATSEFQDYNPGTWNGSAPQDTSTTAAPAESVPPPVESSAASQAATRPDATTDVLAVGDAVVVTITGVATEAVPPHEERIKDDGTITLYLLGAVKATGITAGQLQRKLQKEYERFFNNPVVTVNTAMRYYYVGGEVKRPGAQGYIGKATVTKAIQVAGDFTEFARKSAIQLIRTDGTKLEVNFNKALRNPEMDPEVYPGDKLHVPRRHIW